MRRFPLLLLLASCSPPIEAPGLRGTPSEETRPNILLVVLDDLGWADFEGIPTPSMDAFAAQGVTFQNAWANPVCSSTRYTLQFGRYAGRAGIGRSISIDGRREGDAWDPDGVDDVSIAELLGSAGYSTAAFGKWHLRVDPRTGRGGPRDEGYDTERAISLGNLRSKAGDRAYFEWERVDDGVKSIEEEYATLAQTDAFLAWEQKASAPWFAYLGYSAPHTPLHVPPAELLPPGHEVGDSPREKFEAMVMALDAALEEVLSAVALSDTLVLLVSDNGTAEPSLRTDWTEERFKGSVYEGGINVPLIVAGRSVPARGRVSRALVGTVDVLATVAEVAGIEVPEALDSRSFAACLAEPAAAGSRRFLFSEHFVPNGVGPKTLRRTAARSARYKLIVNDEDGDGSGTPVELFFDLDSDPGEVRPLDLAALSADEAVALAELKRFLAAP